MRANILMALAIATATTAFAADTTAPATRIEKNGAKMRDRFEAADVDHDGLLSRDETAKGLPHLSKHFDEIDKGKSSYTETDLIRTIFPHPTLSETMHEAALDAYGRAIHF